MKVCQTKDELRELRQRWAKAQERVGFVPTMGNLHAGHLQLIEALQTHVSKVIVSIFVNPLQFGAHEDLDTYPRTLEQDLLHCNNLGVDAVFTPNPSEIYPPGFDNHCIVEVPHYSSILCGQFRPVFFKGITTVVSALFHLVEPQIAAFGEKDFQQLWIIQKMVRDLHFPVEILPVPTVRGSDGLALSSRNRYLSDSERQLAPLLYQTLQKLRDQLVTMREDTAQSLLAEHQEKLQDAGFQVDYLELLDRTELAPATSESRQLVVAVAAWLGKTRLIDNLFIDLTP